MHRAVFFRTMLLIAGLAISPPAWAASETDVADEPATVGADGADGAATEIYDAASFLAAYQASKLGDLDTARSGYRGALDRDPDNIILRLRSFRTTYLAGKIEDAAHIAAGIHGLPTPGGGRTERAEFLFEPTAAILARKADWQRLRIMSGAVARDAPTFGILLEAWAGVFGGDANAPHLATGDAAMPMAIAESSLALMEEYMGNGGRAVAHARRVLRMEDIPAATTITMAGVLARQGAVEEAAGILLRKTGREFAHTAIARSLRDGTSPLLTPPDEATLIALSALAIALATDNDLAARLMRLGFARYLAPGAAVVQYHLAILMRGLGDSAWEEILGGIAPDSVWYQPGQILLALDVTREDAARADAIYTGLIAADGENPYLHVLAGDHARVHKNDTAAIARYETALRLGGEQAILHFRRGLALDRLGRDTEAEAAFRKAHALEPGWARVLNTLGYWLLEHNGDAHEALGMIRKAVAAEPDNGAYVDSLGWGYYRLGRYAEALPHLERAATLEPADPVITDHLGDVYARLGRLREAIHEWQRALYYADDTTDTGAIRAKITEAEKKRGRGS